LTGQCKRLLPDGRQVRLHALAKTGAQARGKRIGGEIVVDDLGRGQLGHGRDQRRGEGRHRLAVLKIAPPCAVPALADQLVGARPGPRRGIDELGGVEVAFGLRERVFVLGEQSLQSVGA
jgi:hypothetical protein